MVTAVARIETEHAKRHLAQLRRHVGHMAEHAGPHGNGHERPEVRHIEWSDTSATIDVGWGRCTLCATPEALTLHAEAIDGESLRTLQAGLGKRLETIGVRDHVRVTWQ